MARKTKVADKLQLPTTTLTVLVNSTCVHDYHSGEQFGDWERANEAHIEGVHRKCDIDAYGEHVTIPGDVQRGDTVYVLFMTYSTGDSFGREDGCHEVMWVFTDLDLAKEALEKVKGVNAWDSRTDSFESRYELEFVLENGQKQKVYNPAAGYFESMTDVYLETFTVGTGGKIR